MHHKARMLQIRTEQLNALTRAMHARFDYEAYVHVRRHFPDRWSELGKDGTMRQVRTGLREARDYGFISHYDLLRYLNLRFVFGAGFDASDQYAGWVRPHLESREESPTIRMDLLMEKAYKLLYPDDVEESDGEMEEPRDVAADSEADSGETEDEDAGGFDGIVLGDTGVDPNYVPQSEVPEYEPIIPPPKPGSVPASEVAVAEDDDGGEPIWVLPDEDELDGGVPASLSEAPF